MMGDKSGIQWTEATWNPIVGCSIVSPGCTNCYAMKQAHRMVRMGNDKYRGLTKLVNGNAVWTGEVRFHEAALDQPLRWRRPRMIFVNSMSDLFHEDVPDEWIDRVFAVMREARQHTFQVLTKRAKRMRQYATDRGNPLENVWLGVSAEDQTRWDERIEHLGATPAAVRFVSAEPLLGDIDAGNAFDPEPDGSPYRPIDWVIIGGESGPGARPCQMAAVRRMVEQCRLSDVPVFVKQLGAKPYFDSRDHHYPFKHPKAGDMAEWPTDMQVREMPI